MTTQRETVEQHSDEIIAEWQKGSTIASIARRHGVRRSVVSDLLELAGARERSTDSKMEQRTVRRNEVLEWVREHPGCTVADAAGATGYMHRTVASYLAGTPEAELVLIPRGRDADFSDQEILRSIWQVWQRMTAKERAKGLSKLKYTRMAPGSAPSAALVEKRFPQWSVACAAAGARSAKPARKSYTQKYTDDDLLDAVEEFMAETGDTSFNAYAEWAQQSTGRPSGPLLLNRLGKWNNIRRSLMLRKQAS